MMVCGALLSMLVAVPCYRMFDWGTMFGNILGQVSPNRRQLRVTHHSLNLQLQSHNVTGWQPRIHPARTSACSCVLTQSWR